MYTIKSEFNVLYIVSFNVLYIVSIVTPIVLFMLTVLERLGAIKNIFISDQTCERMFFVRTSINVS